MYLLNELNLKKGDIILLRFDDEKSQLIRRISDSKFSHAMIYVGSSLIDADAAGVHSHNSQRVLIKNVDDVLVLRFEKATTDQLWNIEQFVRSKTGTAYSMEEARKVVRNGEFVPEDNRQFCTRLAAKAYEHAGLQIVNKPEYCSPKDIEDSTLLTQVQNVLKIANAKEIEFATQNDTPLELQEQVTNEFLQSIRTLVKEDIQTFEQVDAFLIKHPKYDSKFTQLLEESSYLTLWQVDIEKNPWHYDFEIFKNRYATGQFVEVGKTIINTCKDLFTRFTIMSQHYANTYSQTKLKYFKMYDALYFRLLELNEQRMGVGIDALIEAGLTEVEIKAIGEIISGSI